MFSNLALRLLGVMPFDSTDADTLAEEIVASLSDNTTPLDVPAGITTNATSANGKQIPAVTVNGAGDYAVPVFQVNRASGDTITLVINPDNSVGTQQGGQAIGVAAARPTLVGSFMGNVVSYSGGNIYIVNVYVDGLSKAPIAEAVTQVQGDPSVPHFVEGSSLWAVVLRDAKGNYSMCLPIWE